MTREQVTAETGTSELLDWLLERWCHLVREAYLMAKTERLNELRGGPRPKLFAGGVHPFSALMGEAAMIQRLLPELVELDPWAPDIAAAARTDAQQEFAREAADWHLGVEGARPWA